jgi:hypothetical protein
MSTNQKAKTDYTICEPLAAGGHDAALSAVLQSSHPREHFLQMEVEFVQDIRKPSVLLVKV